MKKGRGNCLTGYTPSRFEKSSSGSSSDMWQLTTKNGNETVFCKVFSENASELCAEADIYEYLEKSMSTDDPLKKCFVELVCVRRGLNYNDLKKDVMGHFGVTEKSLLRNLMIIQCGNPRTRPALDDLTTIATKESIPNCTLSDRLLFKNMTYMMIVTKKPNGFVVDLNTFLSDPDITNLEKRATLAKTVIAITKMHELDISHNDQHWGNILIADETKDEDGGTYKLDEHTYSLPSQFRPILFDWDRSQVAGWDANPVFREFDDLYTPGYSTTRDWLTFYIQIISWHNALFDTDGDATNESLAKCFFLPRSIYRAIPRWDWVTRQNFWTFASNRNLQFFDEHTNVDQHALMRYLGFLPQRTKRTIAHLFPQNWF
jgi:hypothetical protein